MNALEKSVFEPSKRTRQIAFVLWVTLALNCVVALLKVIFGVLTYCMVIVADGLHSFSDGASNVIGLIGIYLSGAPADQDHPYGHQKYETFASVVIAFFLFLAAFGILREAVIGLIKPKAPEVNLVSFVVMGGTFLVNLFVAAYERRKGRELKSELLLSDSWHTVSDLFVTASVIVALIGIRLDVPRLDALFSLLIAGVILVIAVRILKRSSDVLCDKAMLDPGRIERIVRAVGGVRDCHEIRTRGRINDIYVDLHVLVDNNMTVLASHHLANVIENDIRREIPEVHDVVVHVEPATHDHQELEPKP
ncbi:MAG: cation transporter [Candidatus Omnitrophica bacterium]|nr:cation transporter [Candidatus Omnitrophota bacterium]